VCDVSAKSFTLWMTRPTTWATRLKTWKRVPGPLEPKRRGVKSGRENREREKVGANRRSPLGLVRHLGTELLELWRRVPPTWADWETHVCTYLRWRQGRPISSERISTILFSPGLHIRPPSISLSLSLSFVWKQEQHNEISRPFQRTIFDSKKNHWISFFWVVVGWLFQGDEDERIADEPLHRRTQFCLFFPIQMDNDKIKRSKKEKKKRKKRMKETRSWLRTAYRVLSVVNPSCRSCLLVLVWVGRAI
jgi:hypothetical protein